MFEINLNFANIFNGCFGRSQKEEPPSDYTQLKQALKTHIDRETKLQLILAKISNGRYHSSLLYHMTSENTMKITSIYGNLDVKKDNTLATRNIPILNDTNIVSVLCIRSEKLKPIEVNQELFELLSETVLNEKD
jgi:hypothetical protein